MMNASKAEHIATLRQEEECREGALSTFPRGWLHLAVLVTFNMLNINVVGKTKMTAMFIDITPLLTNCIRANSYYRNMHYSRIQ